MAFEKALATSLDSDDLRIRSLLGDAKTAALAGKITEKMALNAGEKICNVMSHYRVIDFELRRLNMDMEPPPITVRNNITKEQLNGERTARITDKLFTFRTYIKEFVALVNSIQQASTSSSPIPTAAKKSISHLHNLSYAHGKGKLETIINNFRAAAFHLSIIQELAMSGNSNILKENEEMNTLVKQAESYLMSHGVAQQVVNSYVKSTGVANVRLPLHLATLLSPIVLLFGVDLTVSKIPRSTINSLSVAIGNSHPDVLAQLELEIWRTLIDITENSSQDACWAAMMNLSTSVPLKEILSLDPSDSVFSFFKPYSLYLQNEVTGSPKIQEVGSDLTAEHSQPRRITGPEPETQHTHNATQNAAELDQNRLGASEDHDEESQSCQDDPMTSLIQSASVQQDTNAIQEGANVPTFPISKPTRGVDVPNARHSTPSLTHLDSDQNATRLEEALNHALQANQIQEKLLSEESSSDEEHVNSNPVSRRSRRTTNRKPSQTVVIKPRCTKPRGKTVPAPPVGDDEAGKEDDDIIIKAWDKVLKNFVVPDDETPDLSIKAEKKLPILVSERTFTCWSAQGNKFELRPSAHYAETVRSICGIMEQMEASYVNEKPPHLCENAEAVSTFMVFRRAEYEALSQNDVQHLLRRGKIIAIIDVPSKQKSYKQAVTELAPLHQATMIQDHTIPPNKPRTRTGLVQELIDAVSPENRKILNGLMFPRPWAGMPVTSYASDTHALPHVMHGVGAVRRDLPIGHYRFGLVAPPDAWHSWHIDSDGFGTFIKVVTGRKIWISASSIGAPDPSVFHQIGFFFNREFDLDRNGKGLFNVQAIVLEEDTTIIMGPGQMHAVYTMEPSVCQGGHFYATAAMRQTLVSMIHGFICHQYITNITHQHFRYLLAAMISFYHSALVLGQIEPSEFAEHHIPNPEDPIGINDLLIACALGCLMNVLSLDTYCANPEVDEDAMTAAEAAEWIKYDVNAMSDKERRMCCLARGQALQIVAWLDCSFKVTNPPKQQLSPIFSRLLINLCKVLLDYKVLADREKVSRHPNFTFDRLQHQVVGLLALANKSYKCDPAKWKHPMFSPKHSILDCLIRISVERKPESNFEPLLLIDLFKSGETTLDRLYALQLNIKEEPINSVKPDEELRGSNDSEEPESEEDTRPLKRKRQF